MGFIFNGLKAAVTISGTVATGLPQASSVQTQKSYIGIADNQTGSYVTKLTPTAGKTFYLTDIFISQLGTYKLSVADNGTEKFVGYGLQASGVCQISFKTPIPFTTTLQSKGVGFTGAIDWQVFGFEA